MVQTEVLKTQKLRYSYLNPYKKTRYKGFLSKKYKGELDEKTKRSMFLETKSHVQKYYPYAQDIKIEMF